MDALGISSVSSHCVATGACCQPLKNVDLWKKLDQLVSTHDIDWQWVKGHAGEEGNEKADELANRGVPKKNR